MPHVENLRQLLKYNAWANRRALESLKSPSVSDQIDKAQTFILFLTLFALLLTSCTAREATFAPTATAPPSPGQKPLAIFKPTGCSGTVGPGNPTVVLQHPESRFVLLAAKWSDIEPSPGTFDFSALQTKINMVKSYNKKYALAIVGGGPGSPSWLIDSLDATFINYTFRGELLRLPLWWDTVVQRRLQMMVTALGKQFANDPSLALVYVTQMTTNGIEGHLNGIPMSTMYAAGFTPTKWINAAKQTAYYYANAFPNKAIAFEVHEVDGTAVIPETIINDLYNDPSLGGRVGAAIWWLSGKTTYQPDLLNVLQKFPGDKYAQLIGNSSQSWRFQDGSIATAFAQAKELRIRYIEAWAYEYQHRTIDSLLRDFNSWADSTFRHTDDP